MNTIYEVPINIVALGLDSSSLSRVQALFKVFKTLYKNECQLVDDDEADLCIIDFDDPQGDVLWQHSLSQNPSRPNIIIGSNLIASNGSIFVAKPLQIKLLWEAIDKAYKQAKKITQTENLLDITQHSPAASSVTSQQYRKETDTLYYQPNDYLQGYLQDKIEHAEQTQIGVNLSLQGNGSIIIDPIQRVIHVDLPTERLGKIAQMSQQMLKIRSENIDVEQSNVIKDKRSKMKTYRIEKFLWDLVYLTANGRVPQGTNLSQPVFLQHWPNFTRLTKKPNAMRISALLVKHACLLSTIPTALQISQYDGFNFYSAANAIGLASQTKSLDDIRIAPATLVAHKKRNILSALLYHLGLEQS